MAYSMKGMDFGLGKIFGRKRNNKKNINKTPRDIKNVNKDTLLEGPMAPSNK